MLKLNTLCDAAEHHRMQPAPGPADYSLLRNGVVAALQTLYLEVDMLGRLKFTIETNSLTECFYINVASNLTAGIGERSCNCWQSISCCNLSSVFVGVA